MCGIIVHKGRGLMMLSEVFYECRADSIKNFIPATQIKTEQDIEEYNAKGYCIGYTADKFVETFPKIPINKIFYNNGFNKTYYYDASKYIVFIVRMYGCETFSSHEDFQNEILRGIKICEEAFIKKEYFKLIAWQNDIIKFELFTSLISSVDIPNAYELFLDIYFNSDYGFNLLNKELIKKVSKYKTDDDKKKTAEKLSFYDDEIVIYRGEGEKSIEHTKAYSWTTDINIAYFFATKFGSKNARIISAEVKKNDVFEVGRDDEKELIIVPNKAYEAKIIKLYDISDFESFYYAIEYNYQKYRELIDKLNYKEGIHGRKHVYRVLLNALILSYLCGINEKDTRVIATAAAWHDCARVHDGTDYLHGLHGAEKYKEKTPKHNPDTYFLIKNHSVNDNDALKELNEIYKKPKEKKRMQLLFNIIKDADGLDRIRLGRGELDVNYLRLEYSRKMVLLARLICDNIK